LSARRWKTRTPMIASARRPSRPWMWPWLVLPIGVGELVGAPRGGATSFPFHEQTRRCSRYGWSQAQPGATRRAPASPPLTAHAHDQSVGQMVELPPPPDGGGRDPGSPHVMNIAADACPMAGRQIAQ